MNDQTKNLALQLKEACKAGGARWAVWIRHTPSGWSFDANYGLSKARQTLLNDFIANPKTATWLAGTFGSGRARSRQTGVFAATLGCQRLFVFPNMRARGGLVVGSDALNKMAEGFFRALAVGVDSNTVSEAASLAGAGEASATDQGTLIEPDDQPAAPVERPFLMRAPGMELGLSYDPAEVLANVLEFLAGIVKCEWALLSIRFGDTFRVESIWKYPQTALGLSISLRENKILANMISSRQGLVMQGEEAGRQARLGGAVDLPAQSWMGLPVVIGRRVIGHLAFAASEAEAFNGLDVRQVSQQAGRLAYVVENAIVFSEAARYLQQLALLNELASAASLGLDAPEVARRVIQRLSRTFHTELVSVLLLSPDGTALRDYGGAYLKNQNTDLPLDTSLAGRVVKSGLPVRIGDLQDQPTENGTREGNQAVRELGSALVVPLKYRGRVIGALALESITCDAFSQQDEQLLVLIASHLAGLFENLRLNEETRERARQLQDSVRQLQAVRETSLDIAAAIDLDALFRRVVNRARNLVGAKGAELGLLDEKEGIVNVVISETPWENYQIGQKIPLMAGVAGRVAAFGEPLLVDDYNAWNGRLYPEKIAPFKTVAGVPLKFKGQVIGTLTVMDDRPDWRGQQEDMQLLELLAPQVAVLIRNALLYQELQERIEAQRLAENGLIRSARLAAVGEMAAGVAHELNNPLTTVSGFVELVLEDLPADSPIRRDLELVLRESQRARGVVRRLLDFSRQAENRRLRSDLNEVVSDVLTLVYHLARTGGVEIVLELTGDLPWISIDSAQIKQVLLNLVNNAIQAMPGGGLSTVRTARTEREGRQWLTVQVSDTGEGIPPEIQERIFEPFFTTRPAGSGTGLGLSVSYGIVTDHGGFIEVESHPGQGSCFTVYLPLESDKTNA